MRLDRNKVVKRRYAFVLIAILNLIVYGNSLSNGYAGFDDTMLLEGNPAFSSRQAMLRQMGLAAVASSEKGGQRSVVVAGKTAILALFGRNLRMLSHALDYRVFGTRLWGHHLSNVLHHIATACAAFAVAAVLLGDIWGALVAALLFSLHPLQTESVAYLAGRRDVLMSLFYFLGVLFWLEHKKTNRTAPIVLAGVSYLLGIAAKESAVTLPLTLLAYEIFERLRRTGSAVAWDAIVQETRAILSRYRDAAVLSAFFIALSAGTMIFSQWRHPFAGAMKSYGHDLFWYGGSPWTHWATVPRLLTHALMLVVWPASLIADYTYNAFPASASLLDPRTALALLFLGGVSWLAWSVGRQHSLVAFALSWVGITYLPHLPLAPSYHNQQLFAEHWMYLPLFGFALIMGYAVARARVRAPAATVSLAVLMVAACGGRAAARNLDWKDDLTLWSKTVEAVPRCARARNNLGLALSKRARAEESLREFQKAIEIDPGWFVPYFNLGQVLVFSDRLDDAASAFRKSISLFPNNGDAWASLGSVYLLAGRPPGEVFSLYQQASDRGFRSPMLKHNMGSIAFMEGNYDMAERFYRTALASAPDYAMARASLGSLYLEMGRAEDAVRELDASLGVDSDQPFAHSALGLAYGKLKLLRPALDEIEAAERSGLPRGSALLMRGIILRDVGDYRRSVDSIEAARPSVPASEWSSQMGQTYAAMGDWRKAEQLYKKALSVKASARDYYLLALSLERRHKKREASAALRQGLALAPSHQLSLGLLKSIQ